MGQERAYAKCASRRTDCKALQDLIASYNSLQPVTSEVSVVKKEKVSLWSLEHRVPETRQLTITEPAPSAEVYQFDTQGRVVNTQTVWVDPGRFSSTDLVQVRTIGGVKELVFNERPL